MIEVLRRGMTAGYSLTGGIVGEDAGMFVLSGTVPFIFPNLSIERRLGWKEQSLYQRKFCEHPEKYGTFWISYILTRDPDCCAHRYLGRRTGLCDGKPELIGKDGKFSQ